MESATRTKALTQGLSAVLSHPCPHSSLGYAHLPLFFVSFNCLLSSNISSHFLLFWSGAASLGMFFYAVKVPQYSPTLISHFSEKNSEFMSNVFLSTLQNILPYHLHPVNYLYLVKSGKEAIFSQFVDYTWHSRKIVRRFYSKVELSIMVSYTQVLGFLWLTQS